MAIRRRISSDSGNIIFSVDGGAPSASIGYLSKKKAPLRMSGPLRVKDIPKEIDSPEILSHLMNHGFSEIVVPLHIAGTDDADMEAKVRDLNEVLEDAKLYIESRGGRGARAVFEYKTDGAADISYKTIFWGRLDEKGARGDKEAVDCSRLENMELVLICQPYWRPALAVELGPNVIKTPSFERDSDDDGLADHWDYYAGTAVAMESTVVLEGNKSQEVITNAVSEGIYHSFVYPIVAPSGVTEAVAYAWVCRPAAGSDIRVRLRDHTDSVDRDTKLLSDGDWRTEVVGGYTWYRIVVSSSAIVPENSHRLYIEVTTDTATTFYVDKTFWKWGTTICPDEWSSCVNIYNHEDAGAGHINRLDLVNLKGDVDAPIRLRIKHPGAGDLLTGRVFRRTRGIPANFQFHLEAESAGYAVQWPVVADTECSNGNKRSQGAGQTTGLVRWTMTSNLDDQRGRVKIYARVKGAQATTKFRVYINVGGIQAYVSDWTYPTYNNEFVLLDLGEMILPVKDVPSGRWDFLQIEIYYQKADADVAGIDFIQLAPMDEAVLAVYPQGTHQLSNTDYYVEVDASGISNGGIEYWAEFDDGDALYWLWNIRGNLCLSPDVDNHLYFHWTTNTDEQMIINHTSPFYRVVTIAYLPQYISPRE